MAHTKRHLYNLGLGSSMVGVPSNCTCVCDCGGGAGACADMVESTLRGGKQAKCSKEGFSHVSTEPATY